LTTVGLNVEMLLKFITHDGMMVNYIVH